MKKRNKLQQYEAEKREIQHKNLSSEEYEKAIKKITKRLKI